MTFKDHQIQNEAMRAFHIFFLVSDAEVLTESHNLAYEARNSIVVVLAVGANL